MNKRILRVLFVFIALILFGTSAVRAEVVVFRAPRTDKYGDGVLKGNCYPMSLTENISAKTNGTVGPGCTFSVDATMTGEWVTAGGYYDTPPYAWGSDKFYSVSPGDFSYTCSNPGYTIDQSALPSYVQLVQQQDIAGSSTNAPGKRYTFSVNSTAPANSSFTLKLASNTECTMKRDGSPNNGVLLSVDPSDAQPDMCGRSAPINVNPRKGSLSYQIRLAGSCISPTPMPLLPSRTPTSKPTATPTKPPSCGQECKPGVDQCPETCSFCVPGSNGKAVCQGPSPTPTATPVPCNQPCSNPSQCAIECSQCVPGEAGGPSVCKAGCNQPCSNAGQCPQNCPICSTNGRCQPPPPTPTLTPAPVCGGPCKPGIDQCPVQCPICAGSGSSAKCSAPSPTPTPSPVPCNSPCTNPSQCAIQCSQCVPGANGQTVCKAGCGSPCTNSNQCPQECSVCAANGTCAAPSPTPTPSPVPCGAPCSNPSQCAIECSQCVPGANGQTICSAGCGQPCASANSCPQECSICAPSATSSNVVCRLPASCNCDGIDFTGEIAPGQAITATAWGKVEDPDTNDAKVLNMVFHVERDGQEIAKSDEVPVSGAERTTDSNGRPIDRYAATWNYTIPSEGSGEASYRVFAKISCTYKNAGTSTAATNQAAPAESATNNATDDGAGTDTGNDTTTGADSGTTRLTKANTSTAVLGVSTKKAGFAATLMNFFGFGSETAVLGTQDENTGILDSLSNWWNRVMGFNPSPTPTPAPQQATDVNKYIFEAKDSDNWYRLPEQRRDVPGSSFDSLKLGTFNPDITPTPTPKVERMCKQFTFTVHY